MPGKNNFQSDLRTMIGQRQVVAFIGSGVSMATNPQAPTWRGLIKSGIDRCRELGASKSWCCAALRQLALKADPDMLHSAAELIHGKLDEHPGEFARWLRESFEGLEPKDSALIQALAALDIPLVTTNYDDLVEKVTGFKHVCWTDSRQAHRVVRDDDRRVLHLHGHWEVPESVVLGIRSYETVKNHGHTQDVMESLAITKSLLFVGCGPEGLSDPNLGKFLDWLKNLDTEAEVEHRHYQLVRESERFERRGKLYPLVYGEDYDELLPFLESLCSQQSSIKSDIGDKTTQPSAKPELPASVEYYLDRLAQETAHLTMLGMGRSLQVELPIDEAYLPLRTTLTRSWEEHETDRFVKGLAEVEEDVDLGDVFRKAGELRLRGVILLGEPGAGKTTGARQLAWRLAARQSLPQDLGLPPNVTPVFLRFRNLSRQALAEENGLKTFLEAATCCKVAPEGMDCPGADLWNGKAGPLLWILDGLDEVVDPDARRRVSGWIQEALNHRPGDWFLVTCRFQGYYRDGVPLGPKFVEFHVRPLDDRQIERFVQDWFHSAYARLFVGRPAEAKTRGQEDIDRLLPILAKSSRKTGHLRELCTNPLLLTILCIVFHEEKQLPTGRAELYAHCVRVLLGYWRRDLYQADGGIGIEPYDAEAAQAVLARVAWWMHQEQDRTAAPLDDLAEEAAKGLAQVSPNSGLGRDGHAFIQRMRDEAGILAMAGDGEGRCGFLHLSFQEYLAAEHAAREDLAKELATVASESWWHEPALLSLRRSRSFCESFFREMLAAGIAENHPDLAQRCLEEALYFVPGPFVESLEDAPDERVTAVLRLLRERADQVPGLEEISRRYAESANIETRGVVSEILFRQGVEPKGGMLDREVIVDPRTGIAFVSIAPGVFRMGSYRRADEQPVHPVRISQGFLLGKYPVTNAQYAKFLEAGGGATEAPKHWNDRRFNQPEQPVVGVSWNGAQAFCEWAGCRLPTEAEWEYACRAGTTTEYSFGDDVWALNEYAWFVENTNGQLQPVGTKKPNPWGLHDMHGNIWEWCADWFSDDYYAQSPEVDPPGPASGGGRVNRGGGWLGVGGDCRSAYRNALWPDFRGRLLGFRVCLAPIAGESES